MGTAVLLHTASAQVQNLRFDDTDAVTDQIGGIVHWEQPLAGISGIASYAVYLSTTSSSGGTETKVGNDLAVGAWTSDLVITATAIPAGASYLLVYTRDTAGTLDTGTVAYVCLKDLQGGGSSGYARTIYFTTLGYANAYNAKQYLSGSSSCAAQAHRIDISMVATVYYDSGGTAITVQAFDDTTGQGDACTANSDCTGSHECTGNQCQSSTAAFLVSFPTGDDFTTTVSALTTGGYLGSAPVPPFYTGEGASGSGYSLGDIDVSSSMDGFAPTKPDLDIGRYMANTLVQFQLALAGIVDRVGALRLLTLTGKETPVGEVANVWMGYRTATFTDMYASTATLSYATSYVTSTQAQCWQVTSDRSQPSCT